MQGHLEDISAHFVLVVAHLGNNVAHLWDVVATRLGDVAAQKMWWLLFDMGAFFCKCDKRCSGSKGWKGYGLTQFIDGVTQLGESGLIETCGNSFWRRSGSDAIWNGLSRWCNYSNRIWDTWAGSFGWYRDLFEMGGGSFVTCRYQTMWQASKNLAVKVSVIFILLCPI